MAVDPARVNPCSLLYLTGLPGERAIYLARECGRRPELRARSRRCSPPTQGRPGRRNPSPPSSEPHQPLDATLRPSRKRAPSELATGNSDPRARGLAVETGPAAERPGDPGGWPSHRRPHTLLDELGEGWMAPVTGRATRPVKTCSGR